MAQITGSVLYLNIVLLVVKKWSWGCCRLLAADNRSIRATMQAVELRCCKEAPSVTNSTALTQWFCDPWNDNTQRCLSNSKVATEWIVLCLWFAFLSSCMSLFSPDIWILKVLLLLLLLVYLSVHWFKAECLMGRVSSRRRELCWHKILVALLDFLL